MVRFSGSAAVAATIFAGLFSNLAEAKPASSTFILGYGDGQNLTFALNIPYNSHDNDLYFHLSAPSTYNWAAVGCGSEMKGALIFAVYGSTVKDNVTVSMRVATEHHEPVYQPNIILTTLPGTGITNDTYVVNARCQNCRKWAGGSINVTDTAQPWIYALGPNEALLSTSPSAMMRRHSHYGYFSVNMVNALGDAAVPAGVNLTQTSGASQIGNMESDVDLGIPFHVIFAAGTFLIIFPLGVVFRRTMKRLIWHWATQTIGVICLTVGASLGLYESTIYNKTRKVNNAHQIIGLILYCCVVIQAIGGYLHHRMYSQFGKKSSIAPIHKVAGVLIIGVGLINGGLGFQLGSEAPYTDHAAAYSIGVVGMCVIVACVLLWHARVHRKKEAVSSQAAQNFQQGLAEEHPGVPLESVSIPPSSHGG